MYQRPMSARPTSTEKIEILDGILAHVRLIRESGATPVAVLDLDHTLFDNGPRTVALLEAFCEETGNSQLRARLDLLRRPNIPYLMRDQFTLMGVDDSDVLEAATRFWFDRFFTDEWIRHDMPVPGAREYCLELKEAGATLAYLTGRDAPNMACGTLQSLRDHGFPVAVAGTVMLLKPAFEISDLDFKTEAAEFIATFGTVATAFDNEPGNCNLFARRFETCRSVLLTTAAAPGGPAPDQDILAIPDFLRA